MRKKVLVLSCVLIVLISTFALALTACNTEEEYDYSSNPIVGTYTATHDVTTYSGITTYVEYYLTVTYSHTGSTYATYNCTLSGAGYTGDEEFSFADRSFKMLYHLEYDTYFVFEDVNFSNSSSYSANFSIIFSSKDSTLLFTSSELSITFNLITFTKVTN